MSWLEKAKAASDEVAEAIGELAHAGKLEVTEIEAVTFFGIFDARQVANVAIRIHFYVDRDIAIRHVLAIQDRCPVCRANGITIIAAPRQGSVQSF